MVRFSLFGVPVNISPSLWLLLAALGWCFSSPGPMESAVVDILAFALSAFICLLVHEMGHALVGRWFGGGSPKIYMTWLGGDYCNETARLTRAQGIIMTAAGPLACFLLIFTPLPFYMGSDIGGGAGAAQTLEYVGNFIIGRIPDALAAPRPAASTLFAFHLVRVAFWWALINFLPVFPLDGGLIMYGLTRSTRLMHSVSVAVAAVFAFFFFALSSWLPVLLLGSLAFFNYRCLQRATE